MNLVKFSHPVLRDSLFDNIFENEAEGNFYKTPVPCANIVEGKKSFRIDISLPEWKKENLEVELHNNVLSVEGKMEQSLTEGEEFITREFESQSFVRKFELPQTVDSKKISVELKEGVLRVELPKKEESIDKGPKAISIS